MRKRNKRLAAWLAFGVLYWTIALFVLWLATFGDAHVTSREEALAADAAKAHRRETVLAVETSLFAAIVIGAVWLRRNRSS